MIGVYIPVLSGTFHTPILRIIDTELRAAGLHMVPAFGVGLGDERRQAIEGIEFLVERGCDGLIVMTSALQEEDVAALGLKTGRLVALNHSFDSIAEQCFTVDHVLGGRLGRGQGIAGVGLPVHRPVLRQRRDGGGRAVLFPGSRPAGAARPVGDGSLSKASAGRRQAA